jgi:hypothetical protein
MVQRLDWGELFSMDIRDGWQISEEDQFEILFSGDDCAIHISWFWAPEHSLDELEAVATEMVQQLPENQEGLVADGYTVFKDDEAVGVWSDLDPSEESGTAWGVGSWAWVDAVMVMSWVGPPTLSDQRDSAMLMFSGVERVSH